MAQKYGFLLKVMQSLQIKALTTYFFQVRWEMVPILLIWLENLAYFAGIIPVAHIAYFAQNYASIICQGLAGIQQLERDARCMA